MKKYKRLQGFKHPSLEKVVPPKIRLQIYENALSFYEADEKDWDYKHYYNLKKDEAGLCLLLPCILWNLDAYLTNRKGYDSWNYEDTSIAFPELTQEIIHDITISNNNNVIKKRVKYLKKWIKKLKSSYSVLDRIGEMI